MGTYLGSGAGEWMLAGQLLWEVWITEKKNVRNLVNGRERERGGRREKGRGRYWLHTGSMGQVFIARAKKLLPTACWLSPALHNGGSW